MSVKELSQLLSNLKPQLNDELYVFCFTGNECPEGVQPIGTFMEREGLSIICRKHEADSAGLTYSVVMKLITLNVYSSLSAVGMTAAITEALTNAGISANVVAAYHHDHLFVPADNAEKALSVLTQIDSVD